MTPEETQNLFDEANGLVRLMEGGPQQTKVLVCIVTLSHKPDGVGDFVHVTAHSDCRAAEAFVLFSGLAEELAAGLMNAGGATPKRQRT